MPEHPKLSARKILLLAFASAIVTANAYYIHPIIAPVAASFGVSDALVGVIPAANQLALALGVLLVLPLGDRINNRLLVGICLFAQVLALLAMAVLDSFGGFVAAAAVLGFFTITPYLLPAYASKRVDATRLGFVTAVLTAGVIAGVQLARVGSGVVGEFLGWRSVYWIAAGLMALASVLLPLSMGPDPKPAQDRDSYGRLLASMPGLVRAHPGVIVSGVIQGLNFAIFLSTWLGIGLYLTSDDLNLGTDTVGYLSAISLVSLLTTPRLGKWADSHGPERARVRVAVIQFGGIALLPLVALDWWWLLLPIAITSTVGPMVDVTGRMIGLREPPAIRTRLMSLYITLMFVGGAFGSWTGTLAFALGDWWGTCIWTALLSAGVCSLSLHQHRRRMLRAG